MLVVAHFFCFSELVLCQPARNPFFLCSWNEYIFLFACVCVCFGLFCAMVWLWFTCNFWYICFATNDGRVWHKKIPVRSEQLQGREQCDIKCFNWKFSHSPETMESSDTCFLCVPTSFPIWRLRFFSLRKTHDASVFVFFSTSMRMINEFANWNNSVIWVPLTEIIAFYSVRMLSYFQPHSRQDC